MRGTDGNGEQASILVPGGLPKRGGSRETAALAFALGVARDLAERDAGDHLVVAADERRAEETARALVSLAADRDVLLFPPWDCLPYDRASPSRDVMGTRLLVLQALAGPAERPRLVVTCPEAFGQKVAAPTETFTLAAGAVLDRAALRAFAARTGYLDEHCADDPGEIALGGHAIDLFPAGAERPVRIMLDADERITALRSYDPATQRSEGDLETLVVVPASEVVLERKGVREAGIEHRLPAFRKDLKPLHALLPDAVILAEAPVAAACERFRARIDEAFAMRQLLNGPGDHAPCAPDHLYETTENIRAALKAARVCAVAKSEPVPDFSLEIDAASALAAFAAAKVARGYRVVLAGLPHEVKQLAPMVKGAEMIDRLDALGDAPGVFLVNGDFDAGLLDHKAKLVVVAAADVFGARVAERHGLHELPGMRSVPKPGDVVVHEDHGVAILRGLETVEVDGGRRDMLALEYHDEAMLLAPVDELDRIWRYSSEADSVALDRLHTDGWSKRRVKVSAFVEDAAARLVALAAERARARTASIKPKKAAMARFAAGFAFPETADQRTAIADVLRDLASGTPMNRLVCGDVGFGKTEVALRAAAAVALTGRQVAVVAPTTVLARQHYDSFRARFADSGVAVVHLSRFATASEIDEAKRLLATGEAGIVVGTQAVAGGSVAFADIALVIVDEEHRFGTKMKEALRALAPHHLALSATPIPRTLQGALVGVQDVSLLAVPPARRRAVRTSLTPFDATVMKTALLKERRRGGQSFVVVPRIDEVEAVTALLAEYVPELSVAVAHGDLSPEAIDEAMVSFAAGERDILVATSLIESGLDVPRANTMLVWGAEMFGLAQLHQLRGRVGRGRAQGVVHLFAPEDEALSRSTADRLAALVSATRLGSGFTLSARDLDLRGGGDLVGDEQAGHIRLIGASLYQHLLEGAVRAARGEPRQDRRAPEMKLPGNATIPADYVPDEVVRLEFYARFAALNDPDAVDDLRETLRDRFGDVPDDTVRLLSARRLAILAERAGVTTVAMGPKATALSFTAKAAGTAKARAGGGKLRWKEQRLILDANATTGGHEALEQVLTRLAGAHRPEVSEPA